MPTHREQYEKWIDEFFEPHYPELLPQLLEAIEAFDAAIRSGVLTAGQLEIVIGCARSPRKPLGENVAALLGELAARFSAAEQAVREMAVHPKAHVRVHALVAISSTAPTKLHDEVLRTASKDRSSKVRTLAADKIMQFGLHHLLPDLDEAIARENVAKTREGLEFSRDLLRDGYRLRQHDDGRVWVSCRLPGGQVTSTFVSAENLQLKGAKAIAKSLGAEVGS